MKHIWIDVLENISSLQNCEGFQRSNYFVFRQSRKITTILIFCHLLERYRLGHKLFKEINEYLDESGLILRKGMIIDASIIAVPASTKKKAGQRDPQVHQTKGRQ
jgi:IS5 family transposase